MPPPPLAFYCVCNSDFFLGAVALVNSLRLQGHAEPIIVLDCGLSPAQRALLGKEATLVAAPRETTPYLLKMVAPLRDPAEVMVLVDADIIVTRPLTELIERASRGRVLAVEHGQDRFFGEWGELLGATARHRTYVSSSLVLLGGELGGKVLRLMEELQGRIRLEGTPYAKPRWEGFSLDGDFWEMAGEHPFFFADQDVLNAVLTTGIDPDRVEVLDRRLEATVPFTGLRVVDEQALRCAYEDGTEPHVVHHLTPAKPWLEPTVPGVYTQLLLRLLLGRDLAIPIPPRDLPLHMQPGVIAGAKRWYRGPFMGSVRGIRERVRGTGTPTGV